MSISHEDIEHLVGILRQVQAEAELRLSVSQAEAERRLSESTTQLLNTQSLKFNENLEDVKRKIEATEKNLKTQVGDLQTTVATLVRDLSSVKVKIEEVNNRVERQERRLSAIEDFPSPPVRQPPRFYGTDVHSVNLAQRRRIGYTG